MSGTRSDLCVVLHGHLPFVRHPEHPTFLEEDWFFEALTETHLPLLNLLNGWEHDAVPAKMTVSLSPTLVSMMADPLLKARYEQWLDRLIAEAVREVERTRDDPQYNHLAWMDRRRFESAKYLFTERYDRDLISAFRAHQEGGRIELITSAATHAFLPLLALSPASLRTQILVGVQCAQRYLGRPPQGFWLPECGYVEGVDVALQAAGIRYGFLDSHGLLHGAPRPRYGVYAPIQSPQGVVWFGRDQETARQVWSAEEGYPGDPWYREFHHTVEGKKYFRITGRGGHKAPYVPDRAAERVQEHAAHFLAERERQARELQAWLGRPPLIVASYDAELFGHWWFEGPQWLDAVVRGAARRKTVRLVAPSDYLAEHPRLQVVQPAVSSWGDKGYNEVWLNPANDWIYRHLQAASERMTELAKRFVETNGAQQRALNQALRELLLAQSSDWPFIMQAGTTVEYARKRFLDHLGRFTKLYHDLMGQRVDEQWLAEIEARDSLFPELDYRVYRQ